MPRDTSAMSSGFSQTNSLPRLPAAFRLRDVVERRFRRAKRTSPLLECSRLPCLEMRLNGAGIPKASGFLEITWQQVVNPCANATRARKTAHDELMPQVALDLHPPAMRPDNCCGAARGNDTLIHDGHERMRDITEIDVTILGAGTAALGALRQVKDAGKSFALIERGELGTMCARVGCIPSKAVLHAGELMSLAAEGDDGVPAPQIIEKANRLWHLARATRDESVTSMAKETLELAGDGLIRGDACVAGPTEIQVGDRIIRARAIVIATGSAPSVPAEWRAFGDGVLTTDSLFDLPSLPSSIGVIGLGAIGLEMGVALGRLGVRVTGADQSSVVGGIKDPLIAQVALQHFEREMTIWLVDPRELQTYFEVEIRPP